MKPHRVCDAWLALGFVKPELAGKGGGGGGELRRGRSCSRQGVHAAEAASYALVRQALSLDLIPSDPSSPASRTEHGGPR
eukprot:202710-Rhodomonas_salina.1